MKVELGNGGFSKSIVYSREVLLIVEWCDCQITGPHVPL